MNHEEQKSDALAKRLMNVEELSHYISMPAATIYTRVSLGTLPGIVRLGRSLRFERAAIDAWISSQAA